MTRRRLLAASALGLVAVVSWVVTVRLGEDVVSQAMDAARSGDLEGASSLLAGADARPTDPRAEALRIRLVAANGNVRTALIELVKSADVEDRESLVSLLGTLHESLERTGADPKNADPELVRYVLGFGGSEEATAELPGEEQVIVRSLHAFEAGRPVDVAALERLSITSNELPRFIRLARVRGAHAPAGH